MLKIFKRLSALFTTALVSVCTVFSAFMMPTITTFADENTTEFDRTDVLSDLGTDTSFSVSEYVSNNSTAGLMNFVEYCYSADETKRADYGLYVYFYNPERLAINTVSVANQITLAVGFDVGENGIVTATDYEKFSLTFLDKSDGDYDGLFYKFKVVDHQSADGKTLETRVNSEKRYYTISEIELHSEGSNATSYPVGYSYIYSGFGKGLGVEEGSTLTCVKEQVEIVELDVHQTFWRSNTAASGVNHQNQVNAVYFAVDNRLLEEYGQLQRIKAEWYEFETKDIFVMFDGTGELEWEDDGVYSDEATASEMMTMAYNFFYSNLGLEYPDSVKANDYLVADWDENEQWVFALLNNFAEFLQGYDWGMNMGAMPDRAYYQCLDSIDYMYWLLGISGDDVDTINEYDPDADIGESGGVDSNAIYQYMLNYDKSHERGYLPIKDKLISADLFEEDIQEYRKQNNEQGCVQSGFEGKSFYDFDASIDTLELKSLSDTNLSFSDEVKYYGIWNALFGSNMPSEESRTVSPIVTVDYSSDLKNRGKSTIANTYMIHTSLVNEFVDFAKQAEENDQTVVLFRFAQTDYESEPVNILWNQANPEGTTYPQAIQGAMYRAKETVFLDFDIIQLTFKEGEDLTVLGVASNPVDIVASVTPPTNLGKVPENTTNILGIILGILLGLGLVLLIIFNPLLIPKILWAIISAPFKFVKWIIQSIKNRRRKDDDYYDEY